MLATLLALLASLTLAASQQAVTLEEVGESLRSDPVHVDPTAERAISEDEADRLRDAVRGAGTP